MIDDDKSSDYVWHFKLSAPTPAEPGVDAVSHMVREQVEALLRCVTFTQDGEDVRVTGFRFLDDRDTDYVLRTRLDEPADDVGRRGEPTLEEDVAPD
jgi:hypothetical protein